VPREKFDLPKRGKKGNYKDPDYPFKYVTEVF
jgi:hypothetical protein